MILKRIKQGEFGRSDKIYVTAYDTNGDFMFKAELDYILSLADIRAAKVTIQNLGQVKKKVKTIGIKKYIEAVERL